MDRFKLGVRRASKKLMEIVHPNLVISPRALKLMEILISDLNERAVASLVKNGKTTGRKKKKPTELKADCAQKLIEEMLPGFLKKCALAEAHKCLTKFSAGVLKYTPQLRGKKKSKSKSMDAPKEFIRCAPNLLELIDPLAKADQDAKKMVGDILNQMCVQVINKSCELSEKNKKDGILGPQDVIGAVKDCLGPNMARHAIAEGTRNALRYTSGRSLYKSTDFAHKKRKQTLKQNEAFDAVITELKQRNGS